MWAAIHEAPLPVYRLAVPAVLGSGGLRMSRPCVVSEASREVDTMTHQRLHRLVRLQDAISDRTLEIAFLPPGVEADAFTFG
jgi:thioredoxin family protein